MTALHWHHIHHQLANITSHLHSRKNEIIPLAKHAQHYSIPAKSIPFPNIRCNQLGYYQGSGVILQKGYVLQHISTHSLHKYPIRLLLELVCYIKYIDTYCNITKRICKTAYIDTFSTQVEPYSLLLELSAPTVPTVPLAEVARTLFALSWLAPLRVPRARRR